MNVGGLPGYMCFELGRITLLGIFTFASSVSSITSSMTQQERTTHSFTWINDVDDGRHHHNAHLCPRAFGCRRDQWPVRAVKWDDGLASCTPALGSSETNEYSDHPSQSSIQAHDSCPKWASSHGLAPLSPCASRPSDSVSERYAPLGPCASRSSDPVSELRYDAHASGSNEVADHVSQLCRPM